MVFPIPRERRYATMFLQYNKNISVNKHKVRLMNFINIPADIFDNYSLILQVHSLLEKLI